MRRDSIFFQLFQQQATLLFELLQSSPERAAEYQFASVKIKETGFEIDGVFLPPDPRGIVYFCEVQFQQDSTLYERMMAEIHLYAYRYRNNFSDWRAVAIYPSRKIEQSELGIIADNLASGRITRIYLDELPKGETELPLAVSLAVLTIREGEDAIDSARREIQRAQDDCATIDMITRIILYKFTHLTRKEVDAMLGTQLSQSRVYQEALAEGKAEGKAEGQAEGQAEGKLKGKAELVMVQLNRRVGKIPLKLSKQIDRLSVDKLQKLGEALLDFNNLSDLSDWLAEN
jgi:predicted transposase/invertase (TIGR01784 family)